MKPGLLPYPPIEKHGVIGDRRTAALVAADGAVDWWCLPDYDGDPVFGAVIDASKGGYWRFGPAEPNLGLQHYLRDSAVVVTTWEDQVGSLELGDAMLWPESERPQGRAEQRTIIRRLRCLSGRASVGFDLKPRLRFGAGPEIRPEKEGFFLHFPQFRLGLWTSFGLAPPGDGVEATCELAAGDTLWAVLGFGEDPTSWNPGRAESLFESTIDYWRQWSASLRFPARHLPSFKRAAITVHLLGYAPAGSVVAAPTASLPERLGGERNFDYRFAWVRDASLSLALLALFGKADEVRPYMDWLSGLGTSSEDPLQVAYGINGGKELKQTEPPGISGYRDSRPVRFGNHAYRQRQNDSLGYLADCSLIYLEHEGAWKEEYWQMIRRAAEHTAKNWTRPDNGIWELGQREHWISSKVMSWVVLERTLRIARKLGRDSEAGTWKPVRDQIHREVMERGWSEKLNSFRQYYGADSLDGAVLLIPVMDFLPADHPKVLATAERIETELAVNGLVHRFRPKNTPGVNSDLPLGQFECAFSPTTFWLATTYAKAGRPERAEAILAGCEELAGELGLFAEGVDAKTGAFRGNTPLLFSQVEYVRARMELMKAKPVSSVLEIAGATLKGR